MPENSFIVKTENFEGPLELLLNLVEKRKVFINDFSLSQIADEYISFIKKIEHFPFRDISNFIVIASTLILIKSKSLLPGLELSLEEEEDISNLEKRLAEYKLIRSLSRGLKDRFASNIIFSSSSIPISPVFTPDKHLSIGSLSKSIWEIIQNLPKNDKDENPKASIKKVVSLEEMIENLSERIRKNLKITFREFSDGMSRGEKLNTIVGFLAVLELFRTGLINLTQNANFADIHIENQSVEVPRY